MSPSSLARRVASASLLVIIVPLQDSMAAAIAWDGMPSYSVVSPQSGRRTTLMEAGKLLRTRFGVATKTRAAFVGASACMAMTDSPYRYARPDKGNALGEDVVLSGNPVLDAVDPVADARKPAILRNAGELLVGCARLFRLGRGNQSVVDGDNRYPPIETTLLPTSAAQRISTAMQPLPASKVSGAGGCGRLAWPAPPPHSEATRAESRASSA